MFKNKYFYFIAAILTAMAFSLDLEAIYHNPSSGLEVFKTDFLVISMLTIGLYFFYNYAKNKKLTLMKKVLAVIISICLIVGNSYEQIGSWDLIFGNIGMFLLSIFEAICYSYFFMQVFLLLDQLLVKPIRTKEAKKHSFKNNKYIRKAIDLFKAHPFIFSFIVIVCCWLIYIIAFYPLVLSKDPSFQIKQFFNVPTKYIGYVIQLDPSVNLTAHHPVLHTLMLGGCIKLGRFFGSDNFGLFIYAMIQIAVFAASLATTITYLYKRTNKLKLVFILLLIYGLVPMFPFYAMAAVKDTIYTSLIIFYIVFLLYFLDQGRNYKINLKKSLLLLLLIVLIAQFRNNGIYVIVLSLPFFIIYLRKARLKLILVLAIFLAVDTTYNEVLLPYFNIPAGSIRESLSVPFQQTARYVKEHGDDVTSEEKKAIDTVLTYDTLVERYNPTLADAVKNEYNKYTTDEELKEYFKTWFHQFLRHPDTYIEATLNNTYGYFYPNTANWYLYCGANYNKLITEDNLVDYHYNGLSGLRNVLSGYGLAFPYIPIIGLLSNIGFNSWLLLACAVYLFKSNKRKYCLALLPSFVSLLVCFVSPANTYFRYAMPYLFVMPFLLLYTIFLLRKDKEKTR